MGSYSTVRNYNLRDALSRKVVASVLIICWKPYKTLGDQHLDSYRTVLKYDLRDSLSRQVNPVFLVAEPEYRKTLVMMSTQTSGALLANCARKLSNAIGFQ